MDGSHLGQEKPAPCGYADCNLRPIVCSHCSYKSELEAGKLFCKLCKVTENMTIMDEKSESEDPYEDFG